MDIRTRTATTLTLTAFLSGTLALTGCGSDGEHSAAPATPASTSAPAEPAAAPATTQAASVQRTPELDAIGVIGHSGATGADSNGDGQDVPENSWVTGTNPQVDSIYLRLLATHPELEGHAWNDAVSGSDVSSLMSQAESLMAHDPVPDIVFIVSIDNDLRCDGTDADGYDDYEAAMTEVVDYLQSTAPGLKVFFNITPFSVHEYDAALMTMEGGPDHIDWPGSPCDPLTDAGKIDPAGEAYQQQVFDGYFGRLQHICAERTDCATDEGELQQIKATKKDFTPDLNHLTVSGLAREAAVVWEHLPEAWTS